MTKYRAHTNRVIGVAAVALLAAAAVGCGDDDEPDNPLDPAPGEFEGDIEGDNPLDPDAVED